MKKVLILLILSSLLGTFTGCEKKEDNSIGINKDSVKIESYIPTIDFDKDYLKDISEAKIIEPSNSEISITSSGTYEFIGDYNSDITINVNKDSDDGIVYIVMNNANFNSDKGTPIKILESKEVIIVLKDDTENKVSQGAIITDDEEFPSGAIYSKADTVITGKGNLIINTLYNDGINSRDDLIINNCNIKVDSVGDGIVGKDLLAISNSTVDIKSGRDGLKSNNDSDEEKGNVIIESGEFNIESGCDAIQAETGLNIDDGTFNLKTGGGYQKVLNSITLGEGPGNSIQPTDELEDSMKAIKALNIIINDGVFNISSYEDAINSDNDMHIKNGKFEIEAGDDGITAERNLVIDNINVNIINGYEGIESATITINNGEIYINVLDDAMNANSDTGFIEINGGNITLKSQGDGIDSNGDLTVNGGKTILDINSIYSGGDGAVDATGKVNIKEGTVFDIEGNEITGNSTMGHGGKTDGGMRPGRPEGMEMPGGRPEGMMSPEGMMPPEGEEGMISPRGKRPTTTTPPEDYYEDDN